MKSELFTKLDSLPDIKGLRKTVRDAGHLTIQGPVYSGAAMLAPCLIEGVGGNILAICPGVEYAEEFAEDANLVIPGIACHFPALEILPGEEEEPDEAIVRGRLQVLRHLMYGTDTPSADPGSLEPTAATRLICVSINAVIQPVPSPDVLQANIKTIRTGEAGTPREIVEWLVDNGFYSVPQVQEPGHYSLRGGILDVFSHGLEQPVRIEFFGDVVDSIRTFDPVTQLSTGKTKECRLVAAESLFHNPTIGEANLFSYFPPGQACICIEPSHMWQRARELGGRSSVSGNYLGVQQLEDLLSDRKTLCFAAADEEPEGKVVEIECERRDVFGIDLDGMIQQLQRLCERYSELHIFCMSRAEEERMLRLLDDQDFPHIDSINFQIGRLNHGALFPGLGLAFVPHHRLFGRYRQRRVLRHAEDARPVIDAGELNPGDYVVHVQHGIGKFRSLEVLDRKGRRREHLKIEFAEGMHIYVPGDRLELVHRYIGVGGRKPRLSKIHGRAWKRAKKRAEDAVEDLAAELLRLQAVRQSCPGISFQKEHEWEKQFEAEFPYEETEDQLRAIEAVKGDMTGDRPMDRLICGDVGYGKTEIAMRAAFKCVTGGRQVAILVPTTVLAQQHYRTFRERMADYPVRIEMLSRFVSRSDARDIIEDMAGGKVDIVIGTHKLLQDDVAFKRLGLIVIDEEQRFGVQDKERLKQMRVSVDVLTLTATPIPRTLHMSLMGLRDISSLQTPPVSRQAVETRLSDFDPEVLRRAIRRELNREGQVFLVHNRVNSIDQVARMVEKLVPEATVEVGHGQMSEKRLAEVMERFANNEVDVLVSTTIIENGLDMPNANTLIVNRAELLGLAEMHQLRGRVGRYLHKAYAYFFTPRDRPVTPEARRRLRAIKRYSDLGAGFDIALRDLEIRGAGNILGPEQSGHIAAVGYKLYCRLLTQAQAKLHGEEAEQPPATSVNIGFHALLPEGYVPGPGQRMALYRRISEATAVEQVEGLRQELSDRFGELPNVGENLLMEAELRIRAAAAGIDSVSLRDGRIFLSIGDRKRFERALSENDDVPRLIDDNMAVLENRGRWDGTESAALYLKRILSQV